MKKILLFITFLTLNSILSQNIQLFQQYNGKYDFVAIGNTMNLAENNNNPNCIALTQSSATLNLLPNQTIQAAYLYWGRSGDINSTSNNVSLNGTSINPSINFGNTVTTSGQNFNFYGGFADVTSLVQTTGNGTYTLSNLDINSFISPSYCQVALNFAGWSIVVVYQDLSLPNREVSIYHGFQTVYALNPLLEFNLTGLNITTPTASKVGFLTWEGDSTAANNETLRVNNNIKSALPLNPATNAFNSTNSYTGASNLWNMDLDVYNIESDVNVGDSSINIKLTSNQDLVIVNNIVVSVATDRPDASIILNNTSFNCVNNELTIDYSVYNNLGTLALPINTPISFYRNGILIGTTNTSAVVPIGGVLTGTISFVLPTNAPLNFTLLSRVDDIGNGTGIVNELNENNNTTTLNLNYGIIPTFTQVALICSGATLNALPTTSNNGITGTWSPAINNTATTTYTFAPTPGFCATSQTMTIVVNPIITPVFTQVTPICSGNNLAALPTTSTNGITGTWSPALNNTLTTTYTFTPMVGQCATTTTLTITVNPCIFTCPNIVTTLTDSFEYIGPVPGITPGSTYHPNTTQFVGLQHSGDRILYMNFVNGYTGIVYTRNMNVCPGVQFNISFWIRQYDNGLGSNFNINIYDGANNTAPLLSSQNIINSGTIYNQRFTPVLTPSGSVITFELVTITPGGNGNDLCFDDLVLRTCQITPVFTQVAPICSGATLNDLPTTSNNGITGNWSPAINNSTTTTYTFTPNAGQCSTASQTMTIVVNPILTPVFTQVAPICSGATITPLPTTSNNGITGTWSPALNNTATTLYTFTPTAGLCATTQTMTIVVNPNVTPTFTPIAPICSGATLTPLSTTSNNGITGTWSPAINNTATTIYAFTPTAGLCATTQTMTIVVNSNLSPTFTQIAPICSGATLATLPTTSNNGITGTWSPALNNTATTLYTFTPTAGLCATTQTMTIVVNPNVSPTFTQVAPICSGATLIALPTTSNNGITGTWSPAINNTATTTYTFTPTVGQCSTTNQTMTIVVNPNVTPTFTQVAPICSGATLTPLPTTSNNGITGTWSPAINNTATTIYTFTPTAGLCATTQTMTIVVNPILIPTFTQIPPVCFGVNLVSLPTTSNNGITGIWSPAINNTITTTYTFIPNTGQCTTNQTMTIVVNPVPPAPITIIPSPYCLNQTSLPLEATGSNLLWYTTATGGTGTTTAPTPLTTAPGTTNYYVTQTINGCESPRTLIPVIVIPEPSFTTNVLNNEFSMCTGSTSNIIFTGNHPDTRYSWSFSVIGGNNGDVSGAVSGNGALNFTNTIITLIPGITTPRIVTYTVTPFIGLCSGTPVTVTLTINPIPNISVSVYNPICSGEKITITPTSDYPNTIFDWYVSLPQTFGVSGFSNGSGSLIEHILVATGTSAGQVTYVITPKLGNCIGTSVTVTIQVKPLPTANINSNTTTICSGGMPNIIVSSVNTSTTFTYIAIPFNVTGANGGTINSNVATINNQTLIATGNQQGYVDYVFTPTLNECKGDAVTVRVLVNPRPIPTLTNGVICIDTSGNVYQNYVLNAGLDNTNHTFQWSFTPAGSTTTQPLLGNQNTQVASAVGTYTVIATNTTTGCISGSVQATVTSSLPATAITTQVSEMFSGAAMVTVSITGGTGSYLYQLNDENFQESPIFTNVPAGTHTVKVIDTQGCTYLTTTVLIINYMQFFTPNNDGYQDVWKIIGFNQPDAKIYIFDRYGKLLKQLSGSENTDGWNGTLNGQPLPASDYWFTIEYKENNQTKVFKSHFSLKR